MNELKQNLDLAILGNERKAEREYWLNQLAGEMTKAHFPYTFTQTGGGREVGKLDFTLPNTLAQKLQKLSKGADKSLFLILSSGVAALLNKYTRLDDLIIGTPIFHQKEKNLINTILVLRYLVTNELSFKDLLIQSKEQFIQAVQHQNYPLEVLIPELDIVGVEQGEQIFDVAVLLKNLHDPEYLHSAQPNLVFAFERQKDELVGSIEYNSKLYSSEMVQRLLSHFQNLMDAAISHPTGSVKEIDILSMAEREQLLRGFNDTKTTNRCDQTIHGLFEEQVAIRPEKIAIVCGEKSITYGELDQRANQLAHYLLQKKQLQPEERVGIFLERSIEFFVTFLGVLKAGGAYVPMDKAIPEKKLKDIIEDAEIRVLVSNFKNQELLGRLTQECQVLSSILYMDQLSQAEWLSLKEEEDEQRVLEKYEMTPPLVDRSPTALAYLIYTSGTTGKSKGVMIEHKGVANLKAVFAEQFGVREEDRVGQFARYAFDSSVADMVQALFVGASCYVISEEVIGNFNLFEDFVEKNQLTVITMPPTYLTYLNPEKVPSLRIISTAGSAANLELVKKWNPKVEYINSYGPTENSVLISLWVSPKGSVVDATYDSVPIGKPILSSHVFIVDETNQLQPIGVPGELCVSGIGVARGYLNRPELTAEKFVDNPYLPGEKMYRTGDLAAWLEDGNIKFFGRIDNQVKIRGFRIELEEIQTKLLQAPGVKDVAVIPLNKGQDDQYLCAYLVADRQLSSQELRAYSLQELPEYMVPAYFIQLEELPLTPNRKLDTRALPIPEEVMSNSNYVPPETPVQIKLVQVWAEILKLEESQIGINTDFFELGGHSLKGTQLVVKMEKEFGVKIPLSAIFEQGTIKELANLIEETKSNVYAAIPPAPQGDFYPLSVAQERIYRAHTQAGQSTLFNKWEARLVEGKLDLDRLQAAFQKVLARHESLRTSFAEVDGVPVQLIHDEVAFAIEYHKVAEEGQVREIADQFIRPFDLAQAPLLRVGVIEVNEGPAVILFDRHLIISDGISSNLMVRDAMAFYQGHDLARLRIQYKDYAVWQQNFFETDTIQKQAKYWQSRLQGVQQLNLPVDTIAPLDPTYEIEQIRLHLSQEQAAALQELAQERQVTMYMILLAIYQIALAKQFQQTDLVVGSPIAGRYHADLEPIIGMFVNTLAMHNQPEGRKEFLTFLAEVKEHAIQAYENQDYQIDLLLAELANRGQWSDSALMTIFALHNMEQTETRFDNLTFRPYRLDKRSSLYHLNLTAVEQDGGIQLTFEYRTEVYRKATIEALVNQYQQVVEAVLGEPNILIENI